jgi:hypothetical protein
LSLDAGSLRQPEAEAEPVVPGRGVGSRRAPIVVGRRVAMLSLVVI